MTSSPCAADGDVAGGGPVRKIIKAGFQDTTISGIVSIDPLHRLTHVPPIE